MATIVIDPGHTGGYNQGVCYGYYEGNTMLQLGKYLGDILTSLGANIIYTRTTNEENPSLSERGMMAENADLFVSLHSNAYNDPNVRGVYVFNSVQRPESQPFATSIGNAIADAMGNQMRGVVARPSTTTPSLDYYGVLRAAVSVGARHAFLVEHGFHTNMEDCEILSDDNALRRIAAAEAGAIVQYFGLGCQVYYTVQSGESLNSIARKFEVEWEIIATANDIVSPYVILTGQRLVIPLSSKTTTGCNMIYIVKTGDSLYSIAQRYGVAWQAIAAANNITAPYTIALGQQLIIPLAAGSETNCQFIYTVQSGDSLYSIARKYGVTWEAIAAINEIYYPWTITPRQCLIIPLS